MLFRSGHWQLLMKDDDKIIFFDSYGLLPDQCKKWLSINNLVELKEYPNYLSDLLVLSKDRIFYNPFRYQSYKHNVNTCGRWCVARALHKSINGKEFKNFVDTLRKQYKLLSDDQAISKYIYDIINK